MLARQRCACCGDPHNTVPHGQEDQLACALSVGRRGYLQAALSKQKVHATKMHHLVIDASVGHDVIGPKRAKTAIFFQAVRADPVALTKQCQSQTKRELRQSLYGNIGAAEPRHSPRPHKTQPSSPDFSCRKDDHGLNKSNSLFTSIVGSKMSNLSHHNNSLPLQIHWRYMLTQRCRQKMFRLPDSGMPHIIPTQPGGNCLLADKMTSCRFGYLPRYVSGYSVAVYEHKKSPPSVHVHRQKARLISKRSPVRSKYRLHVKAAIP